MALVQGAALASYASAATGKGNVGIAEADARCAPARTRVAAVDHITRVLRDRKNSG